MLRETPIDDPPDVDLGVREAPEARPRPAKVARPDRVDAWGVDSFPASDPPGWWAGPA